MIKKIDDDDKKGIKNNSSKNAMTEHDAITERDKTAAAAASMTRTTTKTSNYTPIRNKTTLC